MVTESSPAGRGKHLRPQKAITWLCPSNGYSISEVRMDAPAWELTEFPEPEVCRKTCADTHHATPGTSTRVNMGALYEVTTGHTEPQVTGNAKAGHGCTEGRSVQTISPQPSLPAPSCHVFTHWQEHNRVHTKYSLRQLPGLCTHMTTHGHAWVPVSKCREPHSQAQARPFPRPSRSPHFPVKRSIWGPNTPPPYTEGVAWQPGKIYHHYPNIISRLDSGSS